MIKKIFFRIAIILAIAFIGVGVWMSNPYSYQEDVVAQALISSDEVMVKTEPWLTFTPKEMANDTGIIFYPGGKTTADTFAPVMRQYAERGYLSIITPMPLKTAFLGIKKADDVIAAYPAIKQWFIVGHSLGGVGASEYVKNADLSKVKGLIFWASYAASDISELPISVLSISASKDLQSTPEKIQLNKVKLPSNSHFVEIEDGNHWQFGYYHEENNEQSSLKDFVSQQNAILMNTLEFIEEKSVLPH